MADFNDAIELFGGKIISPDEEVENDVEKKDDKPPALTGVYMGVLRQVRYIEDYNFFSLSIEITETLEGDKGEGRYLSKTFNIGDSEYQSLDQSINRACKAIAVIKGSDYDTTGLNKQKLTDDFEALAGSDVMVRVRPGKDKEGNIKYDKNGWPRHVVIFKKIPTL